MPPTEPSPPPARPGPISMSDGPLPKSTCGVDISPEAIALHALVARFHQDAGGFLLVIEGDGNERDATLVEAAFWSNVVPLLPKAAALLAQVARERDEALERITRWRAENGGRYWEARFRDEEIRAAAAERQLAEVIEPTLEVLRISDRKHDAWDKAHAAIAKGRALLSGETT